QLRWLRLERQPPGLVWVPRSVPRGGAPRPRAPPLLENFQCYSVRPSRGPRKFAPILGVQVTDGLESVSLDLLKPARLCVPANLDGEDPAASEDPTHLLCYRTRSSASFGDVDFFTNDRFRTDDGILI